MNILIICLLIGVFIGIVFWQIYNVFDEVPNEDRSFLDKPAKGFLYAWPLITALDHHCGHFVSDKKKQEVYSRLRYAGKEYSMSPEQFIAAKAVSSLICGVLVFILFRLLEKPAIFWSTVALVPGYFYPELWIRESASKRQSEIVKRLPFFLDIITLAVESGTNLTGGITQAVAKSEESALRSELSRVLRDIRSGKTRSESLRGMAERAGSTALASVVASMIQAERTGSSLGPILRAQAEQIRSERFLKAEKLAMEAPVKLLGPLVMFIFPCTFIVLTFLVLSKALLKGIVTFQPIVWAYQWPG